MGAKGLLGQALADVFKAEDLVAVDRDTVDITDKVALQKFCHKIKPAVIINAAAYNAVDEIEKNAAAAKQAFIINAEAVGYLAEAGIEHEALLIHFSTDYVFDGAKGSSYVEVDHPKPISVYGRSKLAGEEAILRFKEQGLKYYIIRTSRLFGKTADSGNGKKTFVDIVLEVAAQKSELQFIDDEIASPTFVSDLAMAVKDMLVRVPEFSIYPVREYHTATSTGSRAPCKFSNGVYHRTNDGSCSWYEFAKTVLNESGVYFTDQAALHRKYINLRLIASQDLPRPARRPCYSVLKSTKLPALRHWREALKDYLSQVNH